LSRAVSLSILGSYLGIPKLRRLSRPVRLNGQCSTRLLVLQLVLQVVLRSVSGCLSRPFRPGSAYVSALSIEHRLLRYRPHCRLNQVGGQFAPAFRLRLKCVSMPRRLERYAGEARYRI
jgi:hypothetical protein